MQHYQLGGRPDPALRVSRRPVAVGDRNGPCGVQGKQECEDRDNPRQLSANSPLGHMRKYTINGALSGEPQRYQPWPSAKSM